MDDNIHLLIVDDDITILDIVKEYLTKDSEYKIHKSSTIDDAVMKFKLYRPPVVVIDINLGTDLTGFDLMEKIKSIYPPCQIILMTGMSDKKLIIEAIRRGACDFLEKPFGLEILVHTVNKCIEKWELVQENNQYQNYLQELVNEKTKGLEASVYDLKILMQKTVESLVKTLEARDPYTAGHQERVSIIAVKIAEKMGLCEDKIECVRMSALLHDIGKIHVPSSLLSKPSKLSDNEFNLIKDHCRAGYEILKEIPFPHEIADVVLQHHERLDGTGYPNKLKDTEILPMSRILGVADVVEAICSHRPYRPSLGVDIAIDEIKKFKVSRFDEEVVEACLEVLEDYDHNIRKLFQYGDA